MHERQIVLPCGNTMSTRTPRIAARFNPVISAVSGKKYGVRILH